MFLSIFFIEFLCQKGIIKTMAINRDDIFHFEYFDYGERFHGSYRGMRYAIAREPLEKVVQKSPEEKAEGSIRLSVWPEPFAFDKTPPEQIIHEDFPYSEEGVRMAVDRLNELWERDYAS